MAASSNRPGPKSKSRNVPADTRAALIEAAAQAFNSVGYHGTDTNKIARSAGFAPQTFYRHFRDKMEIFLAVYQRWQAEERRTIGRAGRKEEAEQAIARAVLTHHRRWRIFRRSLRWLAVEDARAREARARSRDSQLEDLAGLAANRRRPRAELVAALLTVERLFDAAADDELKDLGLDSATRFGMLRTAIRACRGTVR